MLDLTALTAHSQNHSELDADPPGEGCFYSTLSNARMEKNAAVGGIPEKPEGQGRAIKPGE